MSVFFVAILLVAVLTVSGGLDTCHPSRRWYVENAEYSTQSYLGEIFIYTFCAEGYEVTSPKVVRCIDGISEEPLPRCQKVKGELDRCLYYERWSVGDREYIPVQHQGEIYIYTKCKNEGYEPTSNVYIRCLQGFSEEPLPQCRKVVGDCPKLPIPFHGSKSCHEDLFSKRTTCKFQCNKAFYIRGSKERVCRKDHRWTGSTPWCVRRPECPGPPPLRNGSVIHCSKEKNVLYEDSCTFQCNKGFRLDGPSALFCRLHGRMTDENGLERHPLCVEEYPKPAFPGSTVFPVTPYIHPSSSRPSSSPCSHANGGCEQLCNDRGGVVHCSCRRWWKLGEDGRTCEDVDECASGDDHCQHICNNTYEGYKCFCRSGYRQIDDYHCQAISESSLPSAQYPYGQPRTEQGNRRSKGRPTPRSSSCGRNNGGCGQICYTTEDGATCRCYDGYNLDIDGKTCVRVRPSVHLKPDIHPGGSVNENTPGHPDVTPPACSTRNGGCAHKCHDEGDTVTCTCNSGYILKTDGRGCTDIDECVSENFGCSHSCVNTRGGAYCKCPLGFRLQEDKKTCEDIDECSDHNLNRCEHNCHNTDGNYTCSCNPGYISLKEIKCQACRRNSYRSSHDVSCLECPPNSYTATEAQTSIGDCLCSPGYYGDLAQHIPCEDINECSTENFGCSHDCVNTPGSAFCSCSPGFELQEDQKTCRDIDECSVKNGGCQGGCHNTDGAFYCTCAKGYSLSKVDGYSCIDVDECQDQNGGCSDLCTNFPGSYHCSCPEGYHMNMGGKSCTAIRCPKFLVPHHSIVRCFNKSDPSNKTFFKTGDLSESMEFPSGTYCRVVCSKGYETDPSARTIECQSNRRWNATLPECEVLQCPPLSAPDHGNVHPPECMSEPMPVKTRCYFTCQPDYRLQGEQMLVCKNNLTWKAKKLPRCVPIKVVPFISCPEDISVSLQPNESSVTLTLPPPLTNVEDFQVEPDWVVVDEPTDFQAGQTDVTFSVISWKNRTIKCQMRVIVSDEVPPVFDFCPDSFGVEGSDVYGIQVEWEEPQASDNVGIASILRNVEPNSTLTPGIHVVEYVAKDYAGNIAKCFFQINVSSGAECSELADPENGEANCMDWMLGKICEPVCNENYTYYQNEVFVCDDSGTWQPSNVIPPCLPECPFGEIWSPQLQKCEEDDGVSHGLLPE